MSNDYIEARHKGEILSEYIANAVGTFKLNKQDCIDLSAYILILKVRLEQLQAKTIAQLQESESNLKSQWMYYQVLLSLNEFDGITDCIAKNNELKKDLRTKEPMKAVTKIIMEDNDRLKDENTQLQLDNAKLRATLRRYGKHDSCCGEIVTCEMPCDCGFHKALGETE